MMMAFSRIQWIIGQRLRSIKLKKIFNNAIQGPLSASDSMLVSFVVSFSLIRSPHLS